MVTGNNSITTRGEFIDDALEQLDASEGILSIFQSEDGLSFSVAHRTSGQILLITDYKLDNRPDAGVELLQQFNEPFSEYRLGWDCKKWTWVPQELFDLKELGTLSETLLGTVQTTYTEVPDINAVLIHENVPPVLERIQEALESSTLLPHPAAEAISLTKHWKVRPGEHVYLHITTNSLNLLAVSNGKLQLHNTYETKSAEDQLYFVLYAYEQLKFNTDEVPLKVTGNILENDALWKSYKKYIRNVEWMENIGSIHSSYSIPQRQLHLFAPLIQLHVCG